MNRPVIVSYGMGKDSTALLIEMFRRFYPAPDAILFADTGGEKPETYEYLEKINGWLGSRSWPLVTVVKYQPVRAPYYTLEGKCLANQTLPSLAFGKHSCALVFKAAQQEKWLKSWAPARETWARGEKIIRLIGYDDSAADRRRRVKADAGPGKRAAKGKPSWEDGACEFRYPLQDWGIDRKQLDREYFQAAGLPEPAKSACYFCPASSLREVYGLREQHPDLYWRAVQIEDVARDGERGLDAVKGLGMGTKGGWAWGWIAQAKTFKEAETAVRDRGGRPTVGLRP